MPRTRVLVGLAAVAALALLPGCAGLTNDPTPTSTRTASSGGDESEVRVLTGREVQSLAESLWEGTDYTHVSEVNVVNNNVQVWLFKDDPNDAPVRRWTFGGAPYEDTSLSDIMALYLPRPALKVTDIDIAALYDEVAAGLGDCDSYAMHWQLAHNGLPLVTGQCDLGEIGYRRVGNLTWQPPESFETAAGLESLLALAAPAGITDLAIIELHGEVAEFEGIHPSVPNLDGSTCPYSFDEGTWQTYCVQQITDTPFSVADVDTGKIAGILATVRADAAPLGGVDHDQFFIGWMDSIRSNVVWAMTGDGTDIIYSFDGVRLQ